MQHERTHQWLNEQLRTIWDTYFADVAALNTVTITWGRQSRTRLGSISIKGGTAQHPTQSVIRISALLRNPAIPEVVVHHTIFHELAHYSHGFCSPHPRKHQHPHRGGVIEQEFHTRNATHMYNEGEQWIKAHWHTHVNQTIGSLKRSRRRRTYGTPIAVSLLSHLQQAITGGYSVGRRKRRRL